MNRPSKEERKRMRKEAEAAERAAESPSQRRKRVKQERKQLWQNAQQREQEQRGAVEYRSHVISPTATKQSASPERILEEAAKVGVRLQRQDSGSQVRLSVPGEPELAVAIEYGNTTDDILLEAEQFDWLAAPDGLPGTPRITVTARVDADPAIDFLHQTMLRVLGRLAQGVLISGPQQYVGDDWVSWSLDYMGDTMFEVTRLYDSASPDQHHLLQRFPRLSIDSD